MLRLDPAEFNEFLAFMGQDVEWRHASTCPCVSPVTGGPDKNCTQCKGKGWVWAAAVAGGVAPAGQKVQREWAQFGQWESGDIVVSIPSDSPLYAMGMHDRVTMLNQQEAFSTTFTHGASDVLPFPVVSISRVYWLGAGYAVVEGGIPTVGLDGVLTWSSGAPPAGKQYSVSGMKRPEFFCWGAFPQDRPLHHGAALPRRVVLRRFDLWGR